jgi:hypothetical protein
MTVPTLRGLAMGALGVMAGCNSSVPLRADVASPDACAGASCPGAACRAQLSASFGEPVDTRCEVFAYRDHGVDWLAIDNHEAVGSAGEKVGLAVQLGSSGLVEPGHTYAGREFNGGSRLVAILGSGAGGYSFAASPPLSSEPMLSLSAVSFDGGPAVPSATTHGSCDATLPLLENDGVIPHPGATLRLHIDF